jgi:hypothetical protein
VWHWYRPSRGLLLSEVRDFFVARCLAVAGLPAAPAKGKPAKRPPAKRARSSKAA